jgi:hypothetical protein
LNKYKIIAVFLLVLFSYQLVPVTVVGSFLYSNQLMEELPHGLAGGSNNCSQSPAEHLWDQEICPACGRQFSLACEPELSDLDSDSIVHSRCADDIQTPPPNG